MRKRYDKLSTSTHYEVLGVAKGADRSTILEAYSTWVRRLRGLQEDDLTSDDASRVHALVRAADEAQSTLTDPLKRFRYDQSLLAQAQQAAAPQELPRHARAQEVGADGVTPQQAVVPGGSQASERSPSSPHLPPQRHASGTASKPSSQHTPRQSPVPQNLAGAAYNPRRGSSELRQPAGGSRQDPAAVVPPPIRRSSPPPSNAVGLAQGPRPGVPPAFRPAGSALITPPPPPSAQADAMPRIPRAPGLPTSLSAGSERPATEALEARIQSVAREVETMMAEMERLAAAVQFALANSDAAARVPSDQMSRAIHALGETRASVVALMAQREEQADHWEAAAALWMRAVRSSPRDASHYVHAATAHLRAGHDLATAESLARQAIELAPDLPDGYATLAAITARRG